MHTFDTAKNLLMNVTRDVASAPDLCVVILLFDDSTNRLHEISTDVMDKAIARRAQHTGPHTTENRVKGATGSPRAVATAATPHPLPNKPKNKRKRKPLRPRCGCEVVVEATSPEHTVDKNANEADNAPPPAKRRKLTIEGGKPGWSGTVYSHATGAVGAPRQLGVLTAQAGDRGKSTDGTKPADADDGADSHCTAYSLAPEGLGAPPLLRMPPLQHEDVYLPDGTEGGLAVGAGSSGPGSEGRDGRKERTFRS